MNRFIKNLSISRKLGIITIVFSVIIFILLIFAIFGFVLISTLGASVSGGEDPWAKAQKDGVFYLSQYIRTQDEQYYQLFRKRQQDIGFWTIARNEIISPHTNYRRAVEYGIKGGADPKDALLIVVLFKFTQPIRHVKIAFADWGRGTEIVEQTTLLGDEIHQKISSNNTDPQDIRRLSDQLVSLNNEATAAELHFAYILNEISHIVQYAFAGTMVLLILVFLGFGIFISRQISRYLYTEIDRLRIDAGRIAGRDFSKIDSISVNNSKDEVGQLAVSFASMAHQLKDSYENLEQKVAERTRELEDALEVKNDFIRIANHQLNTPISILKNTYTMVQEKSLSSAKGWQYMGAGVDRIVAIFNDIKTVLEFDGKPVYHIIPTDLSQLMEKAMIYAKKTIATNKKDLTITIQPLSSNVPSKVMCDATKLNNAIYNLLDNAVYYTLKGSITISYEAITHMSTGYLQVNIKDTGIGISPEEKSNLGQKFYRSKRALLAHPDGSGLGLYIARSVVEAQGGQFFFDSQGENRGSTFSFRLPLAA